MHDGSRARIAVVHPGDEWLGRTVVLRSTEPGVGEVVLFAEHERPRTFTDDLERLAKITGLPVVDGNEAPA